MRLNISDSSSIHTIQHGVCAAQLSQKYSYDPATNVSSTACVRHKSKVVPNIYHANIDIISAGVRDLADRVKHGIVEEKNNRLPPWIYTMEENHSDVRRSAHSSGTLSN